uniref:putative methyltransferase DDB_G0268948 n=1 Tax=Ciona intestinalis TaxID=7719 RepID=UPI0002B8E670|nr:putative methyltransferase DDB_G0268948 [Ciona intestinalis]|eukprot:XP_002119574.2 putative methyltransferase DDB_G0268948 [Ciona intestinalis]
MLRFYENESVTEKYKKFRPHYPAQLAAETLVELNGKKLDFLLDVGCGGGQSVNIFAPYFNQVLAIDPSENQLKEARSQNQFAHVTYKQGNAEKLPRDDVSVDVITVGTAVHWFDRPKFYEEANRVPAVA